MTIAFLTLLAAFSTTFADDREDKLIDRLLKPDMSLSNAAQNKQFATRDSTLGRTVRTRPFYISEKSLATSFQPAPVLSPGPFPTKPVLPEETTRKLGTPSPTIKAGPTVEIEFSPANSRLAPESTRTLKTSSFSDKRPFLVQGKSQKALAAHDRPLTIDEVRELLNKNK